MREKILSAIALAIVTLIANLLLTAALAWPFAFLWNAVAAAIFRAPRLDYWESLSALALILVLKTTWSGVEFSVKFRD